MTLTAEDLNIIEECKVSPRTIAMNTRNKELASWIKRRHIYSSVVSLYQSLYVWYFVIGKGCLDRLTVIRSCGSRWQVHAMLTNAAICLLAWWCDLYTRVYAALVLMQPFTWGYGDVTSYTTTTPYWSIRLLAWGLDPSRKLYLKPLRLVEPSCKFRPSTRNVQCTFFESQVTGQ